MSDTVHMPKEMSDAILSIMRDFGNLSKTKKNLHAGYNFAPVDNFYERAAKLFPDNGLLILSSEEDSELVPMVTGTGNATKTTVWIKTKWRFKLTHNGFTYDDGLFRYATVPTAGPQTEGIAQSYAEKNFMRSLFKVVTGELELDDMDTTEHGTVVNGATAKSKTVVPAHDADTGEVKATTTPEEQRVAARTLYNTIVEDNMNDNAAKLLCDDIDAHAKDGDISSKQQDTLQKVLHARRMIIGSKTIDMLIAAQDAIDAVPIDFRKDGKLEDFLKAQAAVIDATKVPVA